MQLNVQQSIIIHQLQVQNVSNSSVLQVGSAGSIQNLANLYNTGGYTAPVPELSAADSLPYLVPLGPPVLQ